MYNFQYKIFILYFLICTNLHIREKSIYILIEICTTLFIFVCFFLSKFILVSKLLFSVNISKNVCNYKRTENIKDWIEPNSSFTTNFNKQNSIFLVKLFYISQTQVIGFSHKLNSTVKCSTQFN